MQPLGLNFGQTTWIQVLAVDANINFCKLAIKSALNDIEADGFFFFSFQG